MELYGTYKNTTARLEFDQPTALKTWNISHNLDTLYPIVDVYVLNKLNEYIKFWPASIKILDANNVQVVFTEDTAGKAKVK